MNQPTTEPRIIRIDHANRLPAVDRLVTGMRGSDPERARRFLEYACASEIRLDCMWSAVNDDHDIHATVLAVPSPGRTAMVFTSRPAHRSQVPLLATLVRRACEAIGEEGVDVAQALPEPSETLTEAALVDAGFLRLADLSYLERRKPTRGEAFAPIWPEGVKAVAFDTSKEADLHAILEASYIDTLDCPGLIGLRRTEDVIAGHRATGRFDPSMWTLLYAEGRGAGALLLNPCPASESIELVYLGLAPWARGRGFGRLLLQHGLHLSRRYGKERMISLAVDEANVPALRLYRRCGFRVAAHRIAMIRTCRPERPVDSATSAAAKS